MDILYRIVYQPFINRILRYLNKLALPLLAKKWMLPPSGTLNLKIGDIRFNMHTNQTSYVGKILYYKGPVHFEYSTIFKALIQDCKTFLDVGANFGYYSILAGQAVDGISVHAFEPSPGPFHYLNLNIEANGLRGKIMAHPLALSNFTGKIDFFEVKNSKYKYLSHNLGGVGKTGDDGASSRGHKIEVDCTTLDEFCRLRPGFVVDLIKMDTEGTEHMILEGASTVIQEQKPIIICETLFNKIEGELESIFRHHGYLFFNHVSGKLLQVRTLIRDKDNGVRDCFFVHPDKVKLIQSFL